MFNNVSHSQAPKPFNQQTGKQQRQLFIEQVNKYKALLAKKYTELEQTHTKNTQKRASLTKQIQQIRDHIDDFDAALEALNEDLSIDKELDEHGLFGSSNLGRCISAIVQSLALPHDSEYQPCQ